MGFFCVPDIMAPMPRIRFHKTRHRHSDELTKMGCVGAALFGGIFAAAGTAFFIFIVIIPVYQIISAQDWVAVPCTITKSQVKTHQGDDGDTYSIRIGYTYEYNGQTYRGDRYRFDMGGSSSGYNGKKRVVDAHPVGSQQTCYIDPDAPRESVINRGFTHALWWGLFPIPFMAIGYGVIYAGISGKITPIEKRRTKNPSRARGADMDTAGSPDWLPKGADQTGPVTFKPGGSRVGKFVAITFFALFWNGIVSIFVYQAVQGLVSGEGFFTCMGLFMIPFVIIGLVMIGAAFRQLMLIFAPSVVVQLDRRAVPLGGSVRLNWHIAGRAESIDKVTISLIGQEQVRYRAGTSTSTATEDFYQKVLTSSDEGSSASQFDTIRHTRERGEVIVQIPQDTMHSFDSTNNDIIWKIGVRIEVPRWPDPEDQFDITVLPMETGA